MKKRIAVVVLVVAILSSLCLCIYAKQIYTSDVKSNGVTAKGSLYGHQIENYFRLAFSTTYASGNVDYYVDLSTTLYAKGIHPKDASGSASGGVSAQSDQVVLEKSDNITSISSSHSATVYASTAVSIPMSGLSMTVISDENE